MTYLCVPIFVTSLEQARRDALLAAEHGADLIEYRLDSFPGPDLPFAELASFLAHTPVSCVLTFRSASEGGQGEGSDDRRLEALRRRGRATKYVDVELDTLKRPPDAAAAHERLILPPHDFTGRPDRLYNIL